MDVILKEVKIKHVRKDHECNACLWLDEIGSTPESIFSQLTLTDEEKESIIKAHKNKWRVKKGDQAIYRVGICEGDFGHWYSIPEIDEICIEHGLYDT